mmetsp:Transcript_2082/g.4106  ORF Transcript_2082/g.4106 Transcript_2082/m.4106 type:complete len:202 (+) Transcript_2082:2010-2615(+)
MSEKKPPRGINRLPGVCASCALPFASIWPNQNFGMSSTRPRSSHLLTSCSKSEESSSRSTNVAASYSHRGCMLLIARLGSFKFRKRSTDTPLRAICRAAMVPDIVPPSTATRGEDESVTRLLLLLEGLLRLPPRPEVECRRPEPKHPRLACMWVVGLLLSSRERCGRAKLGVPAIFTREPIWLKAAVGFSSRRSFDNEFNF